MLDDATVGVGRLPTDPVYAVRISDDTLVILSTPCTAHVTKRGAPYWRSLSRCAEHDVPFTGILTVGGQFSGWRHAVIEEHDVVTYCQLPPPPWKLVGPDTCAAPAVEVDDAA